jgi:branched-chain amino acid transport system ATP-binding protein
MSGRPEAVEPQPGAAVLEVSDLTRHFGRVRAVEALTLAFREGELVGIVGPNGSGKTTLLNVVTGYLAPDRGRVRYRGRDITGLPPRVVAELGIARSFQMPQLYLSLTVLENAMLALAIRDRKGVDAWRRLDTPGRADEAARILAGFGLEGHARARASLLPEGARKLLDVALSYARRPSVLLMDEPTSGVSATDKFKVMDTLIPVLKQSGITAIFVEHDMEVVQKYAERVLAFNEGTVLADGAPDAVLAAPAVRRAVLGRE